ncbi:MAG: DUF1080 domain-containing protein [Verrucomicrobiales bacterium]|nr:DUF1080 domain-containing protein [Verrucomicrobiales bacterium]
MKLPFLTLLVLASLIIQPPLRAAEPDFVPLFNGRDFAGWTNVNCAPSTWNVRDGMIYCTGLPTGVLRTTRQYENFIFELEWKHIRPGGNSGIFVWSDALTAPGQPFTRSIEVQVLDRTDPKGMWTGHGDVFAIHGATFVPDRPHPGGWMRCLPSEYRAKPAGEWNHYRIECRDGRIALAVNGKVVSGGTQSKPRKGYICLESEGGEIFFRNLRLQEWPSSNAAPDQTATADQGFHSLYTGVDLSGWKQDAGHKGHWTSKDWILDYDGKSEGRDQNLWTDKDYRDFELICDWRFTRKPPTRKVPLMASNGDYAVNDDGSRKMIEVPEGGYVGLYLRDSRDGEINIGSPPSSSATPGQRAATAPKVLPEKPLGEWNRFHITLRGDQVTVLLNGQTIIEKAQLAGIAARGPIGLRHHRDPIQFANLYIRELN